MCSRTAAGRHAHCSGSIAPAAAIYPKGLRIAILNGLRQQLKQDGRMQEGCFGIQIEGEDTDEAVIAAAMNEMKPPAGCSGE